MVDDRSCARDGNPRTVRDGLHGKPGGLLADPNGSMSLACSADVLAPVSIFASSAGNPRSCNATHSSQPSLKSVNVLSIDASAIQA